MATVESAQRPHGRSDRSKFPLGPSVVKDKSPVTDIMIALDRHSRRRPFSSWVRRLANLKNSSPDATESGSSRSPRHAYLKTKREAGLKNSPYSGSGKPVKPNMEVSNAEGGSSYPIPPSDQSESYASPFHSKTSLPISSDGQQLPTISNKSTAPTISTNPDTVNSDQAPSKAGTSATMGGAVSTMGRDGGEGSTFSSPAPSIRSLTTTLTTIQSAAPSNLLGGTHNTNGQTANHGGSTQAQVHTLNFVHQFPSPSPAPAIPSHLAQQGSSSSHPATYSTATANNLLTDNASIMTLASSSKRRRRNSLDTNASVRALAPSSVFGGSRESLPLSVLSASHGEQTAPANLNQPRHASIGLPNAERASVYSSSGNAPALTSERNSYYAGKHTNIGDGTSMRSGRVSHGRNDSVSNSIGGVATATSPLTSPREPSGAGKLSRRSSGWGEVNEEDSGAATE